VNDSPPTAAPGSHRSAWLRFWLTPADPAGLHAVRVLTGLLLLYWLLPLAGSVDNLFGLSGLFDRQAYAEAARLPGGPPAPPGWSLLYLCGSPAALHAVFWASVAVLALFTLGVATRLTGVLTWVVVASFTANPAFADDADGLLLMLTFYLMLGYLLLGLGGGRLSWPERLLGPWRTLPWRRPSSAAPSVAANLAVRLIQVHLAVLLAAGGLHKLQFADWWNGVPYWYALHPPLQTTEALARAHAGDAAEYLGWLGLAAYAALAWQIAFPAFAWRRGPGWRAVLLVGGVAAWVGSTLMFDAPVLGLAVLTGCLSFVAPQTWRALPGRLREVLVRVMTWGETAPADEASARPLVPTGGR